MQNGIAASVLSPNKLAGGVADTLDDLLEADRLARSVAETYLGTVRT